MQEPRDVYPEKHFQSAIAALVSNILSTDGKKFILLEGFGLDITVLIEMPHGAMARFIEVKAFCGQRMGGVGFGNGHGQGAQVDLLLAPANCSQLLDSLVRWVYVDATREMGSHRYCLFTCEKAKNVTMGGVTRGKQNNLRISTLEQSLVDWQRLGTQIQQFLLSAEARVAAG